MKKLSQLFKPLLVIMVVVAVTSCKKEQANTDLSNGEATLARILV